MAPDLHAPTIPPTRKGPLFYLCLPLLHVPLAFWLGIQFGDWKAAAGVMFVSALWIKAAFHEADWRAAWAKERV